MLYHKPLLNLIVSYHKIVQLQIQLLLLPPNRLDSDLLLVLVGVNDFPLCLSFFVCLHFDLVLSFGLHLLVVFDFGFVSIFVVLPFGYVLILVFLVGS